MDIEGIQCWLEDLAAQGLILEKESIFCGFWSFVKDTPRQVRYRLEVVRGKFMEDTDAPREEIIETAESMGWEYVTRYRSFYIYRSFDPNARPLHTDPPLQSLSIKKLRGSQLWDLVLDLIYIALIFLLRRSPFGNLYLDAVTLGPVYALCILAFLAALVLRPPIQVFYLQRAVLQLKRGLELNRKQNWKKTAPLWISAKILPIALISVMAGSLLHGLSTESNRVSLDVFCGDFPTVSIAKLYPQGEITSRSDMGDYNTALHWETSISDSTEWNESGSIQLDGNTWHFILRTKSYQTNSLWLAKGVFKDLYSEDSTRYHGKRFEDLEAPETDLDEVLVYSSYGIRYILIRQGNTVIHATVSITRQDEPDRWEDWLRAMEKVLLAKH